MHIQTAPLPNVPYRTQGNRCQIPIPRIHKVAFIGHLQTWDNKSNALIVRTPYPLSMTQRKIQKNSFILKTEYKLKTCKQVMKNINLKFKKEKEKCVRFSDLWILSLTLSVKLSPHWSHTNVSGSVLSPGSLIFTLRHEW